MTPLLWAVCRCEVGAAVAAAVVWAVTRIAGDRLPARWRYSLWLLVLLRLCLPVLPAIPVHVLRPTIQPTFQPSVASPPQSPMQPFQADPIGGDAPQLPPSVARPATTPAPPRDPARWVYTAWAIIASVLLARLVAQTLRTARVVRTYPRLTDAGLLAELSAAAHLGVRVPLAVVSPASTGPAVTGLLRTRLLLPADLADRIPSDARRLVLLHELAHVRRRDVPVGWLAAAVAAVHWFNPAAWLALSQLRTERELAADAAVLDTTGDPAAYGDTLVRLVQAHLSPTPAAASAMAEPAHTLRQRITMIAHHRPSAAPHGFAAALVGMAVTATAVVWAAATRPTGSGPGLIVSVAGRSLDVRPLADPSAQAVRVALDAAADVRVNGQPGEPDELKPGMVLDAVPPAAGPAAVSAWQEVAGLVVRVDGGTVYLQRVPLDREPPAEDARAAGPADMAFATDGATGLVLIDRNFVGGWAQRRRGTMASIGRDVHIGPGAYVTVIPDGGSGRAAVLYVRPYLSPGEVTAVEPPVRGTLERLDGGRLIVRTFARSDGVRRAAVALGGGDRISVDGDPAEMTDLRPGMKVEVLPGPGRPPRLDVVAESPSVGGRVTAVDGGGSRSCRRGRRRPWWCQPMPTPGCSSSWSWGRGPTGGRRASGRCPTSARGCSCRRCRPTPRTAGRPRG